MTFTETRTRAVVSGDARLAVFEQGDPARPTVLLVHGYPDTHAVWDALAPLLAKKFHVVAYDVRGAGSSSAPRGLRAYRLPLLGQDLLAVADAVSPDNPVHVVAHDWGSIQAWEAVTEPGAPQRIASFTSISGPCLDHVGHWLRRRFRTPRRGNLAQALGQLVHSWYIYCFHLPVLGALCWRLVLARRWARLLERYEDVRGARPAPTLASDAVRGMALYRANMLPRVLAPRQRATEVPVLLIQPEDDHFVRPQLAEDLERWVPRLRRRSLPAKHWVPLTHPERIADLVVEFVDS